MPRYRQHPNKKKKRIGGQHDDCDHPNLQRRGRSWSAIMAVPRDVQQRLGSEGKRKIRFVASLETDSKIEAAERLPAYVSRWRSEIANARRTNRDDEAAFNGGAFGWMSSLDRIENALPE
jgi:hypothetical protein